MGQTERRLNLLHILCLRRHDTYDNLAHEFNVCKRTIRYDVAALMCEFPIETVLAAMVEVSGSGMIISPAVRPSTPSKLRCSLG